MLNFPYASAVGKWCNFILILIDSWHPLSLFLDDPPSLESMGIIFVQNDVIQVFCVNYGIFIVKLIIHTYLYYVIQTHPAYPTIHPETTRKSDAYSQGTASSAARYTPVCVPCKRAGLPIG